MKRVLIANRGEIALRVIRACKDHGLESVAVYSQEDRNALHAQSADYAFSLDGITATQTYLNIEKLIEVAKKSGADSVHPGYGFLSENANFAQAVIDAGLIWIGPPPAAIRALGDKVSARKIAAKAGAPLVAGTKDPVEGHEEVTAFAKEHGLPVAIKAAHGGGGRGVRGAARRARGRRLGGPAGGARRGQGAGGWRHQRADPQPGWLAPGQAARHPRRGAGRPCRCPRRAGGAAAAAARGGAAPPGPE